MSIYYGDTKVAGSTTGSEITPVANQGNVVATVNQNGTIKTLFSGPVGGTVLSGSGVFIDFTKVNTVVTATLSSNVAYEVPYDCKVAALVSAAMDLSAELNDNIYYIDRLENGLGCSIYVKKGTKLKATAITSHSSDVTFLPVS